ncbi:MAG: UDP-2,3-diacylglucosamine diphosphatase LpxI [Pseudomonadota bacterium]
MTRKLGIIAGQGDLPRLLAEHAATTDAPYLVVTFEDPPPDWTANHPTEAHCYERAGHVFRSLRTAGVLDVVFAGGTSRPRLRPWRFDGGALRIGARVLRLLPRGDDALLRGLAEIFEEEGFRMRAAHELLPGLGVQAGVLGACRPSDEDRADARRGGAILRALSSHDVGQGVVVARGLCLGVEAIEGTDALLRQVAELPVELRRRAPAPSGLLLKMPKTGQDRRVDLPTIGVTTIEGAARAGLSGIAIEAGGTNMIDRDATIAAANAAKLFLWAAEPEEL